MVCLVCALFGWLDGLLSSVVPYQCYIVDGFCSANADSVEAMILGRLLVGVGIGVNTALVPLYISEVWISSLSPFIFIFGSISFICSRAQCVALGLDFRGLSI